MANGECGDARFDVLVEPTWMMLELTKENSTSRICWGGTDSF
jgi:hypothetical protein